MPTNPQLSNLTLEEHEKLQRVLDSDTDNPNGLNYLGMHGFLCALAAGPELLQQEPWEALLYGIEDEKDALTERQQQIQSFVQRWLHFINSHLYHHHPFHFPLNFNSIATEEDALTDWCDGFLDATTLAESAWYEKGEEKVGEILLPIVLASSEGSDPVFEELHQSPSEKKKLIADIPERLTDIYLFYRAPVEQSQGPNKS